MGSDKLTGLRFGGAVLLPWLFLTVFTFMFATFLWPRVATGHPLAVILGVFVATVFVAAALAAVTFTRDVISGRYPGHV